MVEILSAVSPRRYDRQRLVTNLYYQ